MATGGVAPPSRHFRDLFEQCLAQAGLTSRSLHLQFERATRHPLPETTVESWRRPHSTTGAPSLPRAETARLLAAWLCGRGGVVVTEAELLAAWHADREAQLARRRGSGSSESRPSRPIRRGHRLPLQLTSFVGRAEEMARLRQALAESRICTLTGTGGSGKTRLALQVAAERFEAFDEGISLVDLASARDHDHVVQAMAAAVGLQEGGTGTYAAKASGKRRPLADRLTEHLAGRHCLLVMDSCERVVVPCAAVVETLLRACPRLHVLCTSREPLGVAGEVLLRVPPLALPDPGIPVSPEVAGVESVRLFLDRARQRRPDQVLEHADLDAVRNICRRLDGLPLAIELAAARVRVLSPAEILDHLEDRFRLLTTGDRTADHRHQTLRATIDWSHESLLPGQRAVLHRLSVFRGGFGLAAARHVCGGAGIAADEVLDLLGALVDKSLVEVTQHGGATRYHLLDTIRSYAAERLAAAGGTDECRARHRSWFLGVGHAAEAGLTGRHQRRWLDELELDHDDLRAATEPTGSGGDEQSLELAASLAHFWLVRGLLTEGRGRLDRLLGEPGRAASVATAKALAASGCLALFDGDVEAAEQRSGATLELSAALGFGWGEASALRTLGGVAMARGRVGEALDLTRQALAASRAMSDSWATSFCLINIANLEALAGRYSAADRRYQESLDLRRAQADTWGQVWSLFRLALLRTWQGRFDEAESLFQAGLGHADHLRYAGGGVLHLLGMAEAAHVRGEQDLAGDRYREAHARSVELGDRTGVTLASVGLANVALAVGDRHEAERWLGSLDQESVVGSLAIRGAALQAGARLVRAAGDSRRALDLHRQALRLRRLQGDVRGVTEQLEELAVLLAETGDTGQAAVLLAAAGRSRSAMGAPVPPLRRSDLERAEAAVLEEPAATGRAAASPRPARDLEDAVDFVGGHTGEATARAEPAPPFASAAGTGT